MSETRIFKAKAARLVGISRHTIWRYASDGFITQNETGRVLLSEVLDVWHRPSKKGVKRSRYVPVSTRRICPSCHQVKEENAA